MKRKERQTALKGGLYAYKKTVRQCPEIFNFGADPVDALQVPVAFLEAQERSFQNLIAIAMSPVTLFFLTPFIRPFPWRRLFFTYLRPVVPLFVLRDGFVSCLRTYKVSEMQQLIREVPNNHLYDWKVGRLRKGPGILLYLIGIPL